MLGVSACLSRLVGFLWFVPIRDPFEVLTFVFEREFENVPLEIPIDENPTLGRACYHDVKWLAWLPVAVDRLALKGSFPVGAGFVAVLGPVGKSFVIQLYCDVGAFGPFGIPVAGLFSQAWPSARAGLLSSFAQW